MKSLFRVFLLAALSLAVLVSCSDKGGTDPVNDLKELHFVVRAHQNGEVEPAVRSFITSNGDGTYTPSWNNGDKLGAFFTTTVISGSTAATDLTLTNTAATGTTGVFEGSTVAAGDGAFYAFYPSSAFVRGYAAGDIGLDLGSSPNYIQHPSLTSPDPNCDILLSKACDYISDGVDVLVDDLLLKRPLSLLKINLVGTYAAGEEISWLKLSVPAGTLTGRVRIGLDGAEITGWATSKSYAWAEYTTSKPVINDATDNVVWLVVNPTTLTSGTTVTVTAETENYTIEKSFVLAGDMVFPEGNVATLNLTIAESNCTDKVIENYELFTTYDAFENGGKYIFAFKDGSDGHYEFIKNNGASSNIIANALTVTAGVITSPSSDYVFTAEDGSVSGSFNFANSDKYIRWTGSTNLSTNDATATDWLATFIPGSQTYMLIEGSGARYMATNAAGTPATKAYALANFKGQVTEGIALAQYAGEISVFRLIDSKTYLSTPTNLAVSDMTVSWDAVSGAASYIVYIDGIAYPVATNSKTASIPAGYYDVAVVAIPSDRSTNLCSQLATLADAQFGSPAIETPDLASSFTPTTITVTWSDDPNAVNGYLCEIYEGLTKLDAKTQNIALGVESVTFTELTENTTYTVKVTGKAVTGAKPYAASETASIDVTPVGQHASDVTAAGSYSITGLEVKAVCNGSSFIAGDATGLVYVYKGSHGRSVGNIVNVSGDVIVYAAGGNILEFNAPTITKTADGDGTATHGSPLALTDGYLTTYATAAEPVYIEASGTQSGRDITVGTKTLYLSAANAATDGKNVVVRGYLYGYNSSSSKYSLVATSIEIDPSVPALTTDPASGSTLVWADDEYGVGEAKTVSVTLNGEATGYTVSSGTAAWTVSDNGSGTITVYPNAANESTEADKTLTLTITHNDNGLLTSTITLKQNRTGAVAPTTYTSTLTSKSWASTGDFGWTSGKDGAGFSNNGIQVTNNVDYTGANGTTNKTFTNVSSVVVTYNTNKSAGAGTLDLKVGTNSKHSVDWAYSGSSDGRSANFTATFDLSASPESGAITLTANTTTNSIYIVSVAVTATAISD